MGVASQASAPRAADVEERAAPAREGVANTSYEVLAGDDLQARVASARRAVDAAEAADETATLARAYLELGRAQMAAGDERAALDALRSAAGLAALHRTCRIHAEARLELAEIAINNGDPTTACEHWQMARMAFLEEGAKGEGERVDRRMRAQGCPTDWVLTDF